MSKEFINFSKWDIEKQASQFQSATPLKCPDDRSRRSLILYYYTNSRPLDEVVDINLKHRALFHNPEDIGVKYDV